MGCTGSDPTGLQGTAADNVEVSTVVWANASNGSSGTMNGIAYWDTSIPLLEGNNVLLLTAFDTTGNNTLKVMNVAFTAPKPPPESSPAGHCGATGLEFLMPLGLILLARRIVRRRVKS